MSRNKTEDALHCRKQGSTDRGSGSVSASFSVPDLTSNRSFPPLPLKERETVVKNDISDHYSRACFHPSSSSGVTKKNVDKEKRRMRRLHEEVVLVQIKDTKVNSYSTF